MKLSAAFLTSYASAKIVECDISHLLSNSTFLLRGRVTAATLANKGKIRKQAQILLHETDSGDFSDWFVTCDETAHSRLMTFGAHNKKIAGTIKCFSDGSLVEDLPDCTERGCDPADLGIWNTKTYDSSDGCKRGYHASGLEKDGNTCYRTCIQPNGDLMLSNKKLRCYCDDEGCSYGFFLLKLRNQFESINSTKSNGTPWVTPCDVDTTTKCPCDEFDEECIDFVCSEARDFVGGEEGIVGTFQVARNYELAYEFTCDYPTKNGEHIGPHIFDGDMSNDGKSRGNLWFFHARDSSEIAKAWIGHETNDDNGWPYSIEYLKDETACVPGFNSIRITQEHDADAVTKQFFFNGVLIESHFTTSSENMYTGELTAALFYAGDNSASPGQIRNFYYRYTSSLDGECFIGETPELTGGKAPLKKIDIKRSFKISLELNCDERVGMTQGTIVEITDLGRGRDREVLTESGSRFIRTYARAEGSPFDPAVLSDDVNSDESNRLTFHNERPLTVLNRHYSYMSILL